MPGLPFAKRSVQPAVRVFFRWERIFVFMLKPWDFRAFFLPFCGGVVHPAGKFPLDNAVHTVYTVYIQIARRRSDAYFN